MALALNDVMEKKSSLDFKNILQISVAFLSFYVKDSNFFFKVKQIHTFI